VATIPSCENCNIDHPCHRIDDEIHEHLLTEFPELKFDDALRVLNEEEMKSAKGKERWRNFIMTVSGASEGPAAIAPDTSCTDATTSTRSD
jgi:hypothetical protein